MNYLNHEYQWGVSGAIPEVLVGERRGHFSSRSCTVDLKGVVLIYF